MNITSSSQQTPPYRLQAQCSMHPTRKHRHLLFVLSFLLISILYSCSPKTEKATSDTLQIVTTTGMIADAVKNIVGEHAEVTALMGPGVDPHLYKATHGDLEKLTKADIIFYNGLHLEGKMGEVLEKLARTKRVVAVGGQLDTARLRSVANGIHDPHIWFDVALWKEAVQVATQTILQADTLHSLHYTSNATNYLKRLDSLHASVVEKIKEIPASQRVLITAHDAFGYFGDAYGVEVRGLQGISTVAEFGLKDVTELVNFIISRKIKAIFIETSVSEKSINAVIEGCLQKNWHVRIGGSLYSDAMGPANTADGTYIGMVHKNVSTIVESLK